jgi:hypothetical protein
VSSQRHVPLNGQELLNVRECSVSSPSSRRWFNVRYQRFLLAAGVREVQGLRRSEMRKHPSFKPAAVAAIGRAPLVLLYDWCLFGQIYSWRSSWISFLSSVSSYLICSSRPFPIVLPFYLQCFLSYLNLESSLVRFIGCLPLSWSCMLILSNAWPPSNGVDRISAGPYFCCVA